MKEIHERELNFLAIDKDMNIVAFSLHGKDVSWFYEHMNGDDRKRFSGKRQLHKDIYNFVDKLKYLDDNHLLMKDLIK